MKWVMEGSPLARGHHRRWVAVTVRRLPDADEIGGNKEM